MITQKRLKELVHYNPETGVFTNLITRGRAKAGTESGSKRRSQKGGVYMAIGIDGGEYKSHRLAFLYMTEKMPVDQIDHINGNGLNNCWSNLREADNATNKKNIPRRKDNSSGITGVGWFKPSGKWQAIIYNNKKPVYLGYFVDLFEAVCARKSDENLFGFHQNHNRVALCSQP